MRTAVIVQARMGSKRFPGKVMADLCGKPVLWHVLTRARQIKADAHVLAVPLADVDVLGPVAKECDFQVASFAGDENDVLKRYRAVANGVGAHVIARITADCPLIEPHECERVIGVVRDGYEDFYSNANPRTVPRGYDCEAFTIDLLNEAHRNATDWYDREHVTPWMIAQARAIGPHEFSIDTPEDLERVRAVMERQQAA